ncbi:MAG: autotransporter outer membrane beta-barrel domain-containing protein [Xanthomonadales bacterium]|nr:autotransporter outer membrane beta-barrel domain-containing protein [Xanthomonadales bacterium]
MKVFLGLVLILGVNAVFAEEADIEVDVRLFQSRIITGDLAKMEITISNEGPNDAEGIRLDIDVTQGMFSDIQTTAPGPCQISVEIGQIRCQNVGTFTAGQQKVVLVRVQLTQQQQPDNLVMQAQVSSSTNDPNLNNNQKLITFHVDPLPNIDEYADSMLTDMPENRRLRFERAARVLAAYCSGSNLHDGMGGLCDDLMQQAELGDYETLTRVLSWMRPRNVVHQAKNSTKVVASQLSNIGQRLSQLRAGTAGFSAADLNLSNGTESLPFSMLAYLADEEPSTTQSFVSPWGFFINGSLTSGDYSYADEVNDGFDFDSDSLSAGVDYRFSNRFVLGAALGYNELDSNTGAGIIMQSEGFSASLYGLFTPTEAFYIDSRISFARPDIRQVRVENFQLIDSVVDIEAIGRTKSEQMTAAISTGYNFYKNAWNITPYFGIEYVNSKLDEFTETGAGALNVFYAEQNFESLKYNLGFNISRAISTRNGVLSPQFSFQHNYEDQDNSIMEMRLVAMPIDELFNVETNFTESSYSQASIGLTWITANGKMFYIRYNEIFGLNNFDQSTISIGARFEF